MAERRLLDRVRDAIRVRQLPHARRIYERDLAEGVGQVSLPKAWLRRYPGADRE